MIAIARTCKKGQTTQKTCAKCGESFWGRKDKRCCSDKCLHSYLHKQRYVPAAKASRQCVKCDKPFETVIPHKRFCSVACERQCRSRKKPRECAGCGKIRPMRTDVRFCSKRCATISRHPKKQSKASILIGSLRPCVWCGSHFVGKWSLQKNKRDRHCSAECRHDAAIAYKCADIRIEKLRAGDTVIADCHECGKRFIKRGDKYVFCSPKCCEADYSRRRRCRVAGGATSGVSKRAVWDRDNGQCYLCGKDCQWFASVASHDGATIDHVIPIAKGGEHTMANVRLACRMCNSIKRDSTHTSVQTPDRGRKKVQP